MISCPANSDKYQVYAKLHYEKQHLKSPSESFASLLSHDIYSKVVDERKVVFPEDFLPTNL